MGRPRAGPDQARRRSRKARINWREFAGSEGWRRAAHREESPPLPPRSAIGAFPRLTFSKIGRPPRSHSRAGVASPLTFYAQAAAPWRRAAQFIWPAPFSAPPGQRGGKWQGPAARAPRPCALASRLLAPPFFPLSRLTLTPCPRLRAEQSTPCRAPGLLLGAVGAARTSAAVSLGGSAAQGKGAGEKGIGKPPLSFLPVPLSPHARAASLRVPLRLVSTHTDTGLFKLCMRVLRNP